MIDHDTKIAAVLAQRDWMLATPNGDVANWRELVADVQRALSEGRRTGMTAEHVIDRAVTYAYCPILLAACREDGSHRQERAFTELLQWIYPRVYARINHPQDAEDVSQKILMHVYRSLHRVEKPHAFLGYVSMIIHRELIDYYHRMGRLDQFEEQLIGKDDDNGNDDGMDGLVGPDSFLEAELGAAEEEIIRMIYECMPKKKWRRAHALVAVALKEQTVLDVAVKLRTTPAAVHLLLFRAREDLPRHCHQLLDLLLQHLTPSQRLSLTEGKS